MIGARALAAAITGVIHLLRFDLRAWIYFDKTLRGFWASFSVAVVMAPLYFAHVVYQFDAREPHLSFVPYLVVQTLTYVVNWTVFPFAMMYIVQLLQRTERYFWHMVPYMWLQLPLAIVDYTAAVLSDQGIIPVGAFGYIELALIATSAVYGTFIAGVGLQVATGTALSLVVLDVVLGLITGQLIQRI